MDHCGNSTEALLEGEQKDRLGKVRNRVVCAVPPSKTLLNRADVPGMEEGIRLMGSLVDFLNGNITAPGAFESFIRKVAKNPSAVSESRAGSVPGRG